MTCKEWNDQQRSLREMLTKGEITQKEYDAKQEELFKKMVEDAGRAMERKQR